MAGQFAARAVKPVFVESSGKRSNWTQLRPSHGASTINVAAAHAAIARQRAFLTRQAIGSASTGQQQDPVTDRVSAHRPTTAPGAAAVPAVGRSTRRNASGSAPTTSGA